jgi:hypothetical protein
MRRRLAECFGDLHILSSASLAALPARNLSISDDVLAGAAKKSIRRNRFGDHY